MCEKAKTNGNKTNHSLRASSETFLFDSGVPEKIIQERTGHRSLEPLRTYERTTEHQHKAVSTPLSVGSSKYSHSKEEKYLSEWT